MSEPNGQQQRLVEGVGNGLGEELMLSSAHLPVERKVFARSEARMCAGGRIRVSAYTQSVDGLTSPTPIR